MKDSQGRRVGDLLRQLAEISAQTKVDGLDKDSRKNSKAWRRDGPSWMPAPRSSRFVSAFSKAKEGTVARQAGLFYGWLLADLQARYRKTGKGIRKWAGGVKFPEHADKDGK